MDEPFAHAAARAEDREAVEKRRQLYFGGKGLAMNGALAICWPSILPRSDAVVRRK